MVVSVCNGGTQETLTRGNESGVSLIYPTRYGLKNNNEKVWFPSPKTISPELTFKADQETHKYKQCAANLSFTNNQLRPHIVSSQNEDYGH